MNTWKCSLLSASIAALSTGWAAAGPAVVLDYLNLRLGPGYNYAVIAVIPAGWPVDAGGCAAGWCQVTVRGIAGYVDANYLGVAPTPVIAYTAPPYIGPMVSITAPTPTGPIRIAIITRFDMIRSIPITVDITAFVI
jgi:uncharacterized protein YraI